MKDIDWDDLRYFVSAARAGSLSAAAVRIGVSVATMSRRLERLEGELGVRLFDRHAGGVTMTPHAQDLLGLAEDVQSRVHDFLRAADATAEDEFAGQVTVTTLETLATYIIAPSLADFRLEYPDIRIVLRAEPRIVKLAQRIADIAVRVERPRESRVVAQRVATLEYGLFASQAYLDRRGRPESPESDLSGFDLVTYDERFDPTPYVAWLHMRARPEDMTVRVSTAAAIMSAVKAGAGLGVLPRFLRDDDLVYLGEAGDLPGREIWLAVHEDYRNVPRVRAVFDHLRQILRRVG